MKPKIYTQVFLISKTDSLVNIPTFLHLQLVSLFSSISSETHNSSSYLGHKRAVVVCEQAFGRAPPFPSLSPLFFFPNREPVHRLGGLGSQAVLRETKETGNKNRCVTEATQVLRRKLTKELVSPRILPLESVDYFGTSEHYRGRKKK